MNDSFSTTVDVALSNTVAGNDSDPNGDSLSFALDTLPGNGLVNFNPDGTFSYTPNAGFTGLDRFTYSASDGALTDTATVDILVSPQGSSSGIQVGLYDAVSDTLIQVLQPGVTIDVLPTQSLAIAAVVAGGSPFSGQVGSMVLDLNNGAVTKTESVSPYALFGDVAGNFTGGMLTQGQNSIEIGVYSQSNGAGTLLRYCDSRLYARLGGVPTESFAVIVWHQPDNSG